LDIGYCGMSAVRTTAIPLSDHADYLGTNRADDRCARVPQGPLRDGSQVRTHARAAWNWAGDAERPSAQRLHDRFARRAKIRHQGHGTPKVDGKTADQLGSMGGGNTSSKICLDEEQRVWAMLHSGSRGTGNRIGSYFIEKAKEAIEKERLDFQLADKDLAFLSEGTELFDDYIEAMSFAQDYAMANREIMMSRILEAIAKHLPPFQTEKAAINCHHNYATRERHFGEDVWVTRKGRRARAAGRSRHHPRLDGHGQLHRGGARVQGELPQLLARRRPRHVAFQGQAADHAGRAQGGCGGHRMPHRRRRDRRSPRPIRISAP
jgi:tRNA-splicing ligase RtcB